MSNIRIFKYNNYFNRIIKRENSLNDYGLPIYSLNDTNFNPNDGVSTTHIIGTYNYDGTGDYLIVLNDNLDIVSHWFILESKRTKNGQWRLNLRRDIIIDYYDFVSVAPMIVSRAMISNPDSPLLFNSEGFNFNHIKQNEFLLQDKTKMPWFILYFKLNTPSMNINFNNSVISSQVESGIDISSPNSPWKTGTYYNVSSINFNINYEPTMQSGLINQRIYSNKTFVAPDSVIYTNYDNFGKTRDDIIVFDEDYTYASSRLSELFNPSICRDTLTPTSNAQFYPGVTLKSDDDVSNYAKYDGQTFILRTIVNNVTNYYKTSVRITKTKKKHSLNSNSSLFNAMKNIIDQGGLEYDYGPGNNAFEVEFYETKIEVTSALYNTTGSYNFDLNFTSVVSTLDAPYYIMAVPMYDTNLNYRGGNDSLNCMSQAKDSISFVNAVIKAAGDTNLLDVQLLPYFPYVNKFPDNKLYVDNGVLEIDITEQYSGQSPEFVNFLNDNQFKCFYKYDSQTQGINAFFIDKSNFTFDIDLAIPIPKRSNDDALNKKLSNELDMYRICSPNYNGVFEFSVAKNNSVDYFNVDVTLKPYSPYIHINPNFKGLYGQDFNDARGLICQGDFSLPIVTDLWKQYEYQNKNYLNTFNRQIEHLDFQQNQERTLAKWNIASGALQGAVAGATAGGLVGGGYGAIAGGAIGGVTSLVGGALDYSMLSDRQREDKDFALDNFKFQLGNIQALPYNINKVTCLTFNNKLFPFVEVYSATIEEETILRNKILYNSMTVDSIGCILDYKGQNRTFISGSLIRLEGTNLSNNEVYQIYDELKKGVYI